MFKPLWYGDVLCMFGFTRQSIHTYPNNSPTPTPRYPPRPPTNKPIHTRHIKTHHLTTTFILKIPKPNQQTIPTSTTNPPIAIRLPPGLPPRQALPPREPAPPLVRLSNIEPPLPTPTLSAAPPLRLGPPPPTLTLAPAPSYRTGPNQHNTHSIPNHITKKKTKPPNYKHIVTQKLSTRTTHTT